MSDGDTSMLDEIDPRAMVPPAEDGPFAAAIADVPDDDSLAMVQAMTLASRSETAPFGNSLHGGTSIDTPVFVTRSSPPESSSASSADTAAGWFSSSTTQPSSRRAASWG